MPVACLLLGALGQCAADEGTKDQKGADAPAVKEPALRKELLDRMKEEQKLRERLVMLTAKNGFVAPPGTKEFQSIAKTLDEADARNRARMKEIIDRYGWPGNKLVGKDGSNAAWLMVQHADPDPVFQKRCLALLAEAVKNQDASAKNLAYLTDRVRVGEKAKQVYGTQFTQVNGKMEPYPIEDEANVDKRRKEVGLPSMVEYRKMMEAAYHPPKKNNAGK